jgi:hypothetical protein
VPSSPESLPFERPEELSSGLRELGATPDEVTDLLPALQRLAEWQAPRPGPPETQLLLARLTKELNAFSPVRQAIREQQLHGISFLLAVARAQVTMLGLGFWLVSALITVIGATAVLSGVVPNQELVLRASGPLLAYLGTIAAFRGRGVRVLELELVCLPSPIQLALARLVIVLGYDVALGLALSLALWVGGTSQVLLLTLSWLMPLLLVAGLALVLSLRLSVQSAASLAYVGWLAAVAISSGSNLQMLLLAPELSVLGGIGLVLLSVSLLRMQADMHRLLPQL